MSLTERLLAMRDRAFAALGDPDLGSGGVVGRAPGFQVLSTTPLPSGVQEVSGTLQVPCYLKTCGLSSATGFHYSSHAFYAPPTQIPGQFVTAPFECIVPPSAGPSTPARISLYGHGFLSTGVDVTEPSQQQLASAYNIVLCSTDWLGLAAGDKWNDIRAMLNPNRLPAQVARMQQGVLDMVYLGRLMISPGGLGSNAAFQLDGQSLLDTSQLYYDGNSTGGIQGGIVTAISPDVTRAVLGVSSIDWANWLIPRTQGIGDFAAEQDSRYADLSARPLLLDLMQQIWDRGDPDGYVQHLISDQFPGTLPHQVLMQTAYGDEYVSMYSAAAEARTIGVDAYQPALEPERAADANLLYGLTPVPGSPFDGSAIDIWDLGAGPGPRAAGARHPAAAERAAAEHQSARVGAVQPRRPTADLRLPVARRRVRRRLRRCPVPRAGLHALSVAPCGKSDERSCRAGPGSSRRCDQPAAENSSATFGQLITFQTASR